MSFLSKFGVNTQVIIPNLTNDEKNIEDSINQILRIIEHHLDYWKKKTKSDTMIKSLLATERFMYSLLKTLYQPNNRVSYIISIFYEQNLSELVKSIRYPRANVNDQQGQSLKKRVTEDREMFKLMLRKCLEALREMHKLEFNHVYEMMLLETGLKVVEKIDVSSDIDETPLFSNPLGPNWFHYSKTIIEHPLRSVEQIQSYKPRGLYFARNNEWILHCEEMGIGNDKNDYCYSFQFLEDLNIYCVNAEELKRIVDISPEKYLDWKSISEIYDGVHVTPCAIQLARDLFKTDPDHEDLLSDCYSKTNLENMNDKSVSSILSFDIETLVLWGINKFTLVKDI